MQLRDQLQQSLGSAYTIERELGGGGMSRVFVADETRLRRKVVVKVLSPEMASGISAERFEREIQLAAILQQANIVPLINVGEADGLPYYTMPFVQGESLRARLSRGPLSIVEVTSILRDVARALSYAHERGIVHRDIKPDNVLLSHGTAVVTDFGIAKALAAAQTHAPGATLTQIGTALGTPAYMAPEQSAGDPATDHRADFYAFGCMAYELLTGCSPFDARSPQLLLRAHMSETARPVTDLRPGTPIELALLVARCMAKDAAERPQTADELLAVLESAPTTDASLSGRTVIVLGERATLQKALALYTVAFLTVAIATKAAIAGIGLPEWVFSGALIVMGLGLPLILFTAYAQYVTRRAMATSSTLTPGGSPALATHGTMATIAIRASPHLSWRRTILGGVFALGAFVLAVGVFMLLRAFGIGPPGSLFAAGRVNDLLVVSDFRVSGVDSSLGKVVSEAVRTQLAQSEVISVVIPTTVAATLRLMQRPTTTPVDLPLARAIAVREGAKAVVDGDVTRVGAGFVLSLRLVTADSGLELATFHETANDLSALLPTLDKAVRELRGKMGESLKRVHADPPLEQVTTASLDALRKFVDGKRAIVMEDDNMKAATLLEEAVAIDSTFAIAYRSLGNAYRNLGYPREKRDSMYAKAYRYRDRLSERERYLATESYFEAVTRDRAKAIATYEELLAHYPKDNSGENNLALLLETRREFTKAESLFRRSVEKNPASPVIEGNLINVLVLQGRLDDATKLAADTRRRFPHNPGLENIQFYIAYGRRNLDSAASLLRNTLGKSPDARDRSYPTVSLAGIWLVQGRLAAGLRLRRNAFSMDSLLGGPWSPIQSAIDSAFIDAWFREQATRAVQTLDAALARHPLRTIPVDDRNDFDIAAVYAMAQRPDKARTILTQYDAEVRDTTVRRDFEPLRHRALAEIALAEHRPSDAVNEIRSGDRRIDGPADSCAACMYAALGRAFDLAGMPDSAIVNFEAFLAAPRPPLSLRDNVLTSDIRHLAGVYKRLGELYEAKGDRQKTASYYAKFIELWKNADPELQPKAEVRAKVARLSKVEGK